MKLNQRVVQGAFIVLLIATLTPFVSAPIALVAGFLFANIFGHPFPRLSGKTTQILLKGSVVGLGFGMDVHSAIEVGSDGVLITAALITLVLTLGYLLGRALDIPRRIAHLTASGTAICGGSAIAAVAPAVGATQGETSIALGVVFLLNSIALLIFPPLGEFFHLTSQQFGMWCAMAIHDTSSVVGAASAYSEEALMVATTVKLARALWIIPISLISAFLFRGKSGDSARHISIPWFIFLFIGAMIANSYLPMVDLYGDYIFTISKQLLVVTLFLIGASLSIKTLREVGVRPLIMGVALWIIVSVLSLTAILHL